MPIVSVIIPTWNAARHLEAAVRSAMAQTLAAIEIIIVDDGSTDATVALADRLASIDARIRVERSRRNLGPAGARNRALALASGIWVAVLDSDDMMVPRRLEGLVAVGEAQGADIVADDLIVFEDGAPEAATLFLGGKFRPDWITLLDYLAATVMYGGGPNFGYLKPIVRLAALRAGGIYYDARLRIAEDDDFIVRALLAGLRYWLQPDPGYGYRRHAASISHRLSGGHALAMLASSGELLAAEAGQPPEVVRALAVRHAAMRKAWAFAGFIEALKLRDAARATALVLADPALLSLLHMPVGAALGRLRPGWLPRRPVRAVPAAVAALATIMPGAPGSPSPRTRPEVER
ncbi:hypothetical protein GCM10007973_00980 [Polymorphobacter multimanifer]|uniref:Succinoglycan biosynthesis protein ExoO n=1 Tax=Polymorphobacter multimanifer TaxID=1070431 RepID=A0A841LBQ8_9SPHN|nr:glycosyltransferase family 2 protein [Polymorphobacter multimanifer]MBB6226438.1 succinoglycan biosynthesis protein ExoO [Polymorphobacter multimanifer]GGI67599.1 hypothetical protein GCM10007973_00980 [Polymorphobacter multimanifer]